MYLAYIDESGDKGKDGSRTYTLGCVVVRASKWPETFDALIGYRRYLKTAFGIPVRSEIKANHLLRNGGPFRTHPLPEKLRAKVYLGLMRLQPKLGITTFAVVINKAKLSASVDSQEQAWTFLLQRLERMSHASGEGVMVIHDEGEGTLVRKWCRKARRIGTAGSMFGGYLKVPFKRLIDDPVSRNSEQSYFLQLADLNAYAAFRRLFPPPARAIQIVPERLWDELGAARLAEANRRSGGPSPGIVFWPK